MVALVMWSSFLALAAPAADGPTPSAVPAVLNGAWQLDAKASEPLDPILKALGYGWLARRIMRALAVKQKIRTTAKGVAVRVMTRFSDDTIVMPFNNVWAPGRTLDGGETQRRSRWAKDSPTLITEDRFTHGLLITRRQRVGPRVMHEALEFRAPGQATLRAVRVFRRP